MKYSFSLSVIFLLVLMSQVSSAGTITIRDSVYADSIYLFPFGTDKVVTPERAFGAPDSQYAHFGPLGLGPLLDLMFTHSDGVTALTIQKNATVHIWGMADTLVDSSAAQVKFVKTDPDGVIVNESQWYILGDGLNTITLADTEYTYLEFTLTGTEFNPGSQGYYLDAVLLVQDRDSTTSGGSVGRHLDPRATQIVASYPNPFVASAQQTNVTVRLAKAGNAVLRIFDVLGHEVTAVSLGYLGAGDYHVPVGMTEPQMYFARLYVDGVPTARAYRLIAQ
jgi:hypothetical protein